MNDIYKSYMELTPDPDPAILKWIKEETVASLSNGELERLDGSKVFGEIIIRYGDNFTLKQ